MLPAMPAMPAPCLLTRLARLAALALLTTALALPLAACGDGVPDIIEPTPWAALNTAFDTGFFDPAVRAALFTEPARAALILPDRLAPARYRFLSVAELRRVDDRRRIGEVAFTIDGWPASLAVELTLGDDGGWRITEVESTAAQERLLEVLGPTGLPIVKVVEPWKGGFAGRDAAGRPTAAVLLLVIGDRVQIDGGEPLPLEEAPVVEAITHAIRTRRELADDAHATYRPHVALALPRAAPSTRHAELADWAVTAGAEALQLVVRSREGTPAWIPLARRVLAAPGSLHNVLRLGREGSRLVISVDRETIEVPDKSGQPDFDGLAAGLRAMVERVGRPDGGVIVAHPDVPHGALLALHVAARAALPDVPFTSEVPE